MNEKKTELRSTSIEFSSSLYSLLRQHLNSFFGLHGLGFFLFSLNNIKIFDLLQSTFVVRYFNANIRRRSEQVRRRKEKISKRDTFYKFSVLHCCCCWMNDEWAATAARIVSECVFIKNSSKHTNKLWNIWKKCLQLFFRCCCRECRCWTIVQTAAQTEQSQQAGTDGEKKSSAAANNRKIIKKSSTIKRFFSSCRLDSHFYRPF